MSMVSAGGASVMTPAFTKAHGRRSAGSVRFIRTWPVRCVSAGSGMVVVVVVGAGVATVLDASRCVVRPADLVVQPATVTSASATTHRHLARSTPRTVSPLLPDSGSYLP